ncbi:MAG: hypothetical protein WCW53_12550 [Syntrophales bacterium]|jgi:hypothetical protein
MRIEPENNSVSIVLVGSLNPAIFHPSWFVANDLLSKSDIESAEVEIVHRNIAIFKVGDWLRIQVDPNRFVAETTEPPFIRLFDIVVRTFKEALIHTPIIKMGINRRVHFSVGDEETRNKIGMKLAPQEVWGEWASHIAGKEKEKHGGLTSLSMSQIDLDDREDGYITAKVTPSKLVKNGAGIFIEVNDHYEINKEDPLAGATPIIDILRKQFDVSIRRSEWIIDQIMDLKEKV